MTTPHRSTGRGRPSPARHMPAIVAVVIGVLFALPLLWVLAGSLRPGSQVLDSLDELSWRSLIPTDATLHNYVTLFQGDFGRAVLNSVLVAAVTVALGLLVSASAAFGLSVFEFRGRGLVFAVILLSFMIPFDAIAIPLSSLFRDWNLQNTYAGLILPGIGNGLAIFLLRQFLLTIPDEYLDAAKVDGCGELRTLLKVVLPMAKPGIAAVALFQFFYAWNDYFGPQIYASENPGAWTLSYGLESFKGAHHTDWNLTMAATVLVMAPVILVFFFAQKAFVEGVTLTGVKG
ncbi:carbohydrate ABC transporter permease [Nocardia sp. NPDC003354]